MAANETSWIVQVLNSGVFGTVLGFILGLFADPMRRRLFAPTLGLKFSNDDQLRALTTKSESEKYCYVRGRLLNKSGSEACRCRVFVTAAYYKPKDKHEYEKLDYGDSLQLRWSAVPETMREIPLDLPGKVSHCFDVVLVREEANPRLEIKCGSFPTRYADQFTKPGDYWFKIVATATDSKPTYGDLEFRWDGKWDGITVTEREF